MNTLLKILIAILCAVSAYCEVSLFVSFAGTTADQWLAGIFAGGMVAGQFLFVDQMATQWRSGQRKLAAAAAGAVLVLMLVSVSGTAFYFESRYQATVNQETTGSDEYQLVRGLIEAQQNSLNNLKRQAQQAEEKGNTWIAGQYRLKATEIEEQLPALFDRLQTADAGTGTAAIIGNTMAGWRWAAWWLFGTIADLMPALAIVLLRNSKTAAVITEKQSDEQPEQAQENSETADHNDSLQGLIDRTGAMPSWSQLRARGWGYTRYKREREQLEQAGVIRQKGQGWEVVKAA